MFFFSTISTPPFASRLPAIFPSIMPRFKFPLWDGRLNDSSSVSIYHLAPPNRIVIYRVCMWPYLRAYAAPAGSRYRDIGKLKFYDDSLWRCRNSFPDIGLNSRARPYLHCTCRRNGHRIHRPTRHRPRRRFSSRFSMAWLDDLQNR